MKQRLSHQLLAIAAIGAASLSVLPSSAIAHQVQTDYILKDLTDSDTAAQASPSPRASIELHSAFTTGEPLKGANVVIYAPNQPGRVWGKGVTDSEGRFDFTPNAAIRGDWEVEITRAGHADILTVPVSENGIEGDLVSQSGVSDTHYAEAAPWAIGGSIAIAAACIGFTRISGKREVE